jgi:glycosyltransferase involved in cell wall biosynthesis
VALTVGRLWDEAKNLAVLDRAAGLLDRPVLAAGAAEGPGGQRFEARHVRLLGRLEAPALAERMAGCAVFVSPAFYEPFGLAALEAARAGMALVLSDRPGFRELWGETALYVDPHDAEALAGALDRLLGDPAESRRLGRAAAGRARRYASERMTLGTLAAYRRALAHAGRAEPARGAA